MVCAGAAAMAGAAASGARIGDGVPAAPAFKFSVDGTKVARASKARARACWAAAARACGRAGGCESRPALARSAPWT